jgi:hypothetical protein
MKVALQSKTTGQIKLQKIGWSWTCFLWSEMLGIPLFLRGLNVWGAVMVLLWIVSLPLPLLDVPLAVASMIAVSLIQLGLAIFFGLKANRMAGKRYLENGWEFAEPNSIAARVARSAWGLPVPSAVAPILPKELDAVPVILNDQKTAVQQVGWRLIAAAAIAFIVTFMIVMMIGR